MSPGSRTIAPRRLALAAVPALIVLSWALAGLFATRAAAAGPCDPPVVNQIVCENSKPGAPQSQWDIADPAGDPSIQGFATDISVDQGQTVHFKIDTASTAYHLDIYRMGYYGGDGARKVATVTPSASLPQNQPPCLNDAATGLVDCGNWADSASWAVPADAVSGIYFAKLIRDDAPSGGSHILFVVRDDDGHSDLLFQTSDTTWQAYNRYGGNSLYTGGPGGGPPRAYKVSYNRPLTTRGSTPEDSPFNAEYPMVRWLERNGYDVSYFTGVDADRRGAEILEHKAYLSVGHDEYWSGAQRANVEAARAAGVNLGFFSGNEIFWKTRWENSIDGSGTDHRTLVSYKETHANAKIDPNSAWTGTWRDPRFSPPADGGRPENALSGTIFTVDAGTTAIQVPAADGKLRLWRNTSVASLAAGQTATLADDTLGYEWDEDLDNGSRPPGLIDLSSTTYDTPQRITDYGSNYAPGTATHHLTLYRASSGALVFGAGTVQWSWGLDGEHDRGTSSPDPRMQQATVNLLADMGVQPASLQADLVGASASTDTQAPSATITAPSGGANFQSGSPITISGTASDAGGGQVGGVEVSTDAGASWHPAQGRENWTYTWTPGTVGAATIRARAVDDSGNLQTPGDQVSVNVVPRTCPCSIWDASTSAPAADDPSAVEVGVKFRSDQPGYITGLRFYKTAANTGTHVGHLWTAGGTQLAEATFTGESASGWQQVNFDNPVAIDADTTYIASYHAPNGNYAATYGYFFPSSFDSSPLHALGGADGPNGVYKYGPSGGLFSGGGPDSFGDTNYWVDVVFANTVAPDTTPPTISSRTPAGGAGGVSTSANPTATFSEPMDPTTIDGNRVELRGPGDALVPATVSYNAAQRLIRLHPDSALQSSITYTVKIKGGAGGVADQAGNPLVADSSWSFTTAAPRSPPDEGPGGPILVISNSADPFSRYYAEILRAEGLNEFNVTDLSNVNASMLANYDVAILAENDLSTGQVSTLTDWVQGGGNLIAMRPDPQLSGLLGLNDASGTLSNAYLKVDTSTGPGAGIVDQTIQFHGTADRYTTSGAQAIASLYSTANAATANPAVTMRSVGPNGGQAAAFSYDLARSVIYTRQGNPAWAGDERDGSSPIRSDDLFFGAKQGDIQPDWVDLNKVAIPQADEQQRLLANLIEQMNVDRKPLPQFWFLPRDEKAAVVMTGDDHGNGGTAGRFAEFAALGPNGCSVADWQCVRATSYIYPDNPSLSNSAAAAFQAAGFEIALHPVTGCADWSNRAQLESFYSSQLDQFAANYPSLDPPASSRTHCIPWSDWATQPKVELEDGIRFDTNYYYWPPAWVADRPGMFTGSGMPMRFADQDGSMIDVYQAATQMTDESGQTYPFTIDTLLDNALGPQGYYGVFTANMHNDSATSDGADAIVASALARGVPVVSARQMLTWLDGRNNSSFGAISWSGNKLSFTIDHAAGANGLRAMVPVSSAVGDLTSVKLGPTPVTTTTETIKGRQYAFFDAAPGSYLVAYGNDPPTAVNDQKTLDEDSGATTIDVRANDTDPDGGPKTISSATQPAHGTVTVAPDGSDLSYRPNPDYCNTAAPTDDFTYTLNGGSSATVAVSVNCVDDPPHAVNDQKSVDEDSGTTTIDVRANDTDPDGGPKTISSATQPAHGTVTVAADGSDLSYRPNPDYCNSAGATDDFTYTLNGGSTATVAVSVTCEPDVVDAPQITSTDPASPSSNAGPKVIGTLGAGRPSLVEIFTNANCSGAAASSGDATQFTGAGIAVTVPSDATTALSARAKNVDGDTSNCSNSVSYTEDSQAPSIPWVSPLAGATGVSRTAPIVVGFDQAMDKPSAEAAFSLKRTSNGAAVPGSLVWYGNALIFLPTKPLDSATSYTASESVGAKDPAGNPLSAPKSWQFTTATQPLITTVVPAESAAEVLPNGYVVVVFDTAMDKASAQSAFSLKRSSDGVPVSGSFIWYGNALIFDPASDLAPATQYTATVSTAAKDSAGHPLPVAKSWKFTTTNRPIVNYLYPADGATGVSRASLVIPFFNKAMDKPSAEAAFTLKRTSDGATVPGTFGWYGNALIFTPSSPLGANTQYTASVSGSAKDLAANTLANPTSWRFTTGP